MSINKRIIASLALVIVTVAVVSFLYGKKEIAGEEGEKDKITASIAPTEGILPTEKEASGTQRQPEQTREIDFDEIKNLANRGNAEAQLRLSQSYQKCFIVNQNRKAFEQQIERAAKRKPQFAGRLKELKEKYERFCQRVDQGQPVPQEAIDLWRQESAKAGNLVGKVLQAGSALTPPKDEEIEALIQEIKNAKNPEAVFHAGAFSERAQQIYAGTELSPAFEGPYAPYAWQVAACRSGFDCSQNAVFMETLCISSAICGDGYEDEVLNSLIPSGAKKRFYEQVNFIRTNFLQEK